ncbi:MAG TPA: hypothetical protein VFP50_19740 [Anaeromyxobacteraceae bacterium]|nr:hypothetical protein [Anaeromyxobacteraceae bacterium]
MMVRSTGRAQRLSSALTLFHKVIIPALWLGAFGVATTVFVIDPPQDGPSPAIFAAALLMGGVAFYRWGFAFKKVTATDRGLIVSNYRREVLVPYEQIASVRENKFINIRPITVELRTASAFGTRIQFMPYSAWVLLGDHPAAMELRRRVEATR